MHLTEQHPLNLDMISLVLSPRLCSCSFCFFESPNSCKIIQEVHIHFFFKKKGKILNNFDLNRIPDLFLSCCFFPFAFLSVKNPYSDLSHRPMKTFGGGIAI